MPGRIAIESWTRAGRRTSCLLFALLLLVAGVHASAPPSELIGPVDADQWKSGPVYVMHLDGGSRHGLIPEIFADYLEAARSLNQGDLLIVVIDGQKVTPQFFSSALDFVEDLSATAHVVALVGDVEDGAALLALTFRERYVRSGSSLTRSIANEYQRSWRLGSEEGALTAEIVDRFPVSSRIQVEVVVAMLEQGRWLLFDRDDAGQLSHRTSVQGIDHIGWSEEPLSISAEIAADVGLMNGEVATERELAIALTANERVELVRLGEDVGYRWAGRFELADEHAAPLLYEVYGLLRGAGDEEGFVEDEVIEELQSRLPRLYFWERELGSVGHRYSLPEGTARMYRDYVEVMRRTGKHPSWLTQTELEALAEDWPYRQDEPKAEQD